MENFIDIGLEEFPIAGGGVLRFHPADPNLYERFFQAEEKLKEIEAGVAGLDALTAMTQADRKIKELLNWVFGGDNDFHKALGGVNVLAVCGDGQVLAQKLFAALEKVLTAGAERLAEAKAAQVQNA